MVMKAAIYARVSTERQAERGTIGSQVQALRAYAATAGYELAGEYCDDGHSGARLDRPGLDALRDAAQAGLFEVVCCLSPDRLARSYAYQVLILDELARFGVSVAFADAPGLDQDDPQARLLTQVQGVIAEYENYAELGIVLVMPTARLCRPGGEMPARMALVGRLSRHNHRPSRKASRVSDGL
jgi:site-specific DNA recombinase